ncbi:hypothetical protein HWV62_11826 [Athelia sp. TMB]|nr:hypothetical protein HWV62_11826 [Athelia sp. TMB]
MENVRKASSFAVFQKDEDFIRQYSDAKILDDIGMANVLAQFKVIDSFVEAEFVQVDVSHRNKHDKFFFDEI